MGKKSFMNEPLIEERKGDLPATLEYAKHKGFVFIKYLDEKWPVRWMEVRHEYRNVLERILPPEREESVIFSRGIPFIVRRIKDEEKAKALVDMLEILEEKEIQVEEVAALLQADSPYLVSFPDEYFYLYPYPSLHYLNLKKLSQDEFNTLVEKVSEKLFELYHTTGFGFSPFFLEKNIALSKDKVVPSDLRSLSKIKDKEKYLLSVFSEILKHRQVDEDVLFLSLAVWLPEKEEIEKMIKKLTRS